MDERYDAMLMRKAVAIREGMQAGKINPLWADRMMQQIVDNNHSADLLLRPVLAQLRKPPVSQIQAWIRDTSDGVDCGFDLDAPELRTTLRRMRWDSGPSEVQVTRVTMKNLFLDTSTTEETDSIIRNGARLSRLRECPAWVVPALAMHASENAPRDPTEGRDINICLADDWNRKWGFCLRYRRKWFLYAYSADPNVPWSGPMDWLFAMPSIEVKHF